MLKFPQNAELRTWFGDFGGAVCVNDTDVALKEKFYDEVSAVWADPAYASAFKEALAVVLKDINTEGKEYVTADKRVVMVLPDLGSWYNMAGQLAIAKLLGRKKIFAGSKCGKTVRVLADSCKKLGFELSIILGRELCGDKKLIEELRSSGVEVNDTNCVEFFDLPESYIEAPFSWPVPGWVVPLKANYAPAPRPAMVGTLAGLYGAELMEKYAKPECIAATMTDGTGALGVFKAWLDTDVSLFTVEKQVAQEYHVMDHNCYTLSIRSSENEAMPTTICPELVNLWRKGRVIRLGCDRMLPLDISAYKKIGMSDAAARAAAFVLEATNAKTIMLVEG